MAQVQKKEIKDKIIASAKMEFFKEGYDGANMRNIAGGAGVTAGNLYKYFSNKDELYNAVVSQAYIKINEVIERNTQMAISIQREVTSDEVAAFIRGASSNLIKMIVDDSVSIFSEDRLSMLILLRDRKGNPEINMKYSLIEWIQFCLSDKGEISKYLAHSFVEGLISIALDFDDDKAASEIIEKFVNFYFVKEH